MPSADCRMRVGAVGCQRAGGKYGKYGGPAHWRGRLLVKALGKRLRKSDTKGYPQEDTVSRVLNFRPQGGGHYLRKVPNSATTPPPTSSPCPNKSTPPISPPPRVPRTEAQRFRPSRSERPLDDCKAQKPINRAYCPI